MCLCVSVCLSICVLVCACLCKKWLLRNGGASCHDNRFRNFRFRQQNCLVWLTKSLVWVKSHHWILASYRTWTLVSSVKVLYLLELTIHPPNPCLYIGFLALYTTSLDIFSFTLMPKILERLNADHVKWHVKSKKNTLW